MSFFNEAYRSEKRIKINLEEDVLEILSGLHYEYATPFYLNFEIWNLIYSIGIINTKRVRPTKRQKLQDYDYLINYIRESNDLRFNILLGRETGGPELLKDISADIGIGIGSLILVNLFEVSYTSLSKIKRTGVRPDIISRKNDLIIVLEGKGTIIPNKLDRLKITSRLQKNSQQADIKLASISLLKEEEITEVFLIDPPSMNEKKLDALYLKAQHYVNAFNLIGEVELAKYFISLGTKLLEPSNEINFNIKQKLFEKIKEKYSRLVIHDLLFYGNFYADFNGGFIFKGILSDLIDLNHFRNFESLPNDFSFMENQNQYWINRDGICYIIIKNSKPFIEKIRNKKIEFIQKAISIADIDVMNIFQIENYFNFVFKINGFEVEVINNYDRYDLILIYRNYQYIVEYQFSEKADLNKNKKFLYKGLEYNTRQILITNQTIGKKIFYKFRNLLIIDRKKLISILRQPLKFQEYVFDFFNADFPFQERN